MIWELLTERSFLQLSMDLDFNKLNGLIPAVIQDHVTGRVLMLGFMNREAFDHTVSSGFVTFFSRSRRQLWTKGESSGHFLKVKEIAADCDADSLLVRVEPSGPGVCHEGYVSCFFRSLKEGEWSVSEKLAFDPATAYGGTS